MLIHIRNLILCVTFKWSYQHDSYIIKVKPKIHYVEVTSPVSMSIGRDSPGSSSLGSHRGNRRMFLLGLIPRVLGAGWAGTPTPQRK